MIRRPPRSTRTDTLFPYTTLFRSGSSVACRRSSPSTNRLIPPPADRNHTIRSTGFHTGWTRGGTHAGTSATREFLGAVGCYSLDPSSSTSSGQRSSPTFYRSEEHTSELQSLMRISYAVFCLKKKTIKNIKSTLDQHQQNTL